MSDESSSGVPRWILIGTAACGLLAAALLLVVRVYEVQKARAEARAAEARAAEKRAAEEPSAPPPGSAAPPVATPGPPKPPVEPARSHAEVDLLAAIDVSAATTNGPWRRDGRFLVSPRGGDRPQNSWVLMSRPPAENYRLELEVERIEEGQGLNIGLMVRGTRCAAVVDGFASIGGASGLEMVDGKPGKSNDTTRVGKRLPINQRKVLAAEVRAGRVTLWCDGDRVFEWSGGVDRLSPNPNWPVPEPGRLFLGSQAGFRFSRIVALPLD